MKGWWFGLGPRSSPEELVSSAFFSLCQIHQIMPSQHGNSLSVTNYSGTDAMAYKFMTTSMEDMMIIYQCTPSRHSKAADHHLKWIRQIWAYQLRFFWWTYVSMSFESEPCWFHDGWNSYFFQSTRDACGRNICHHHYLLASWHMEYPEFVNPFCRETKGFPYLC